MKSWLGLVQKKKKRKDGGKKMMQSEWHVNPPEVSKAFRIPVIGMGGVNLYYCVQQWRFAQTVGNTTRGNYTTPNNLSKKR